MDPKVRRNSMTTYNTQYITQQNNQKHYQQGLTLTEILVALAILGMVMGVVFSAMLSNTKVNTEVEYKAQAARIYERQMEDVRGNLSQYTYDKYGLFKTEETDVVVNGRKYKVIKSFCRTSKEDTSTDATKFPCTETALFVEVEVKKDGEKLYKGANYFFRFGKA